MKYEYKIKRCVLSRKPNWICGGKKNQQKWVEEKK